AGGACEVRSLNKKSGPAKARFSFCYSRPLVERDVRERDADRRSVDRDVVHDGLRDAISSRSSRDPVAGLAGATLGAAEARHARRTATALADVLALVTVRNLVVIEELRHALDV